MLRIGLTGGIASGKSTVLRRLAAAGLETLDLDRAARAVMAPGQPAYREIVEEFGPGVVAADGAIDRARLGGLVFRDAARRARLNAIVHPRVRAEEAAHARALEDQPAAALVTDAALLVETGQHTRFDRLIVVYCRPDLQLARLRARDGLAEEDARARLAAQMPGEDKRRFAHFPIDSSGDRADTEAAADGVAHLLVELARRPRSPDLVARGRVGTALVHGPQFGPRGLTPGVLAEVIARCGELDFVELARRMDPPSALPWYERGAEAASTAGAGPASLAFSLGLFEAVRKAFDLERLAAVAFSLAWLTDRDPGRLTSAVFVALLAAETAHAGRVPSDHADSRAARMVLARRWGGGDVGPDVAAAAWAAAAHPGDPAAAATASLQNAGEPGLAAGLASLAGPDGSGDPGSPGGFASLLLALDPARSV
jgi:dephospho-CoA kinase